MARKRGGLAGFWGLPLAVVLFYAMPSLALARKAHAERPSACFGPYRHIGTSKLMSLRAQGFYPVVASRFPASNVDQLRDGLQVLWVKTCAVPAQVVDLQSFWDGSTEMRVCQTMRVKRLRPLVDTQRHNPVAMSECAGINPAFVVSADIFGKTAVEVLAGIHTTRVPAVTPENNRTEV